MARDIDLLETAAKGLAYTKRPGFGSHALLTLNGVMFAAVASVGRIAVKLPDPALFADLASRGAISWEYGTKPMEHWLLLPRETLAEPEQLREWVRRAHALALHPAPRAKAALAVEDADRSSAPVAPEVEAAPAKKARKAPAAKAAAPAEALKPAKKAKAAKAPPEKPSPKRAAPAKKAAPKKAAKKARK